MHQPDLPMDFPPVFDFDERDPWPLPPGGPIVWPVPRPAPPRMVALRGAGAALASVLLGMVKP